MKTCFFMGHRDAPSTLYPQIRSEIGKYIAVNEEVEFLVGRYGNFDAMSARAVIEWKQSFPSVRLMLLVPYLPAKPLPLGFDGAFSPPDLEFVPKRAAIVRANQYAVKHCDAIIAYVTHPASNAWNVLQYAQSRIKRNELSLIRLG